MNVPLLPVVVKPMCQYFDVVVEMNSVDPHRIERRSAAHAILVFLVCALLAACDGGVRLRGIVVDPTGVPVPKAEIHLEPGRGEDRGVTRLASENGCFSVMRVVAPGRRKYKFRVMAPGFAAATGEVETIADNYARVVLRRTGDAEPSSVQLAIGAWPAGTPAPDCR